MGSSEAEVLELPYLGEDGNSRNGIKLSSHTLRKIGLSQEEIALALVRARRHSRDELLKAFYGRPNTC
jgi:hypothetical protein